MFPLRLIGKNIEESLTFFYFQAEIDRRQNDSDIELGSS